MAESLTIGANTGDVPYALLFDSRLPTYSVMANSVLSTTTADHCLQIMAGSSLNVRIKRIEIFQVQVTTVNSLAWDVIRLTTAGTGGTALTPQKLDNGDAAAGATGMSLPTAKGTEAATAIRRMRSPVVAAQPTNTNGPLLWTEGPRSKPIIIPAGTANGIAFKVVAGVATVTWDIVVEFVETSYV